MVKNRVPKPGDSLTVDQLEEIFECIAVRRERFPEESGIMSLGVVLFNFGDRYAKATCVAGEWTGLKQELPRTTGIPKCPNGHVLTQEAGLRLGWVT